MDPITPPAGPPAGGAAVPKPAGDPIDTPAPKSGPERDQALARKLRKAEKELADLRKERENRQNSELTETERLKKAAETSSSEVKTLKEQLKQQALKHRFETAAAKAGVVDSEDAFKLANLSDVEIDEFGKITGLDEAIKALKESKAYLFGAPVPPAGVGSLGGNPPGRNPLGPMTSEDIERMSPAQFETLMADVSSGRVIL